MNGRGGGKPSLSTYPPTYILYYTNIIKKKNAKKKKPEEGLNNYNYIQNSNAFFIHKNKKLPIDSVKSCIVLKEKKKGVVLKIRNNPLENVLSIGILYLHL